MKKLAKKLLLLFISIQFVACEGSLEPHLYGVVDTGNAFNTPADLSAATVALYYELRQKGWGPYLFCDGSSFVMDEVSTEEWTTKWSWVAFLNGSWTDADQMVKGFYNWTAPNITRCTYTIAKMEESPVAQSVKDLYIAEVRALRAFFMFDLYRLYGPMPMILEADQAINPDPDYKPYRPTSEEVGTFLTTELRAAADALPVEQAEYGRITKGAALHYLLKYYMHEKQWQNALETANEIIGLNYYELEKDYASIFSAQNEGNKELMFVVRAEPLADYGNHTYANILPGDYASPYGNIVEGWSGHRMPWEFYDTFDENDRRRALAQAEYTSKSGATVDLRASGDVGALPLKYGIDPEATGTWAGNDKVLIIFHTANDRIHKGSVQVTGSDKEIGLLVAVGLLPKSRAVRLIGEALVQSHSRRKHISAVIGIDNVFAKLVFIDKCRSKLIEAVSAAVFPFYCL